jgi:predicted site-specific integrase-resolvase
VLKGGHVQSEELLTRHEAARRAGVTYNTIQLWMRAGRLHPVGPARVGGAGRPVIRATELEEVIRQLDEERPAWERIWEAGG